jgi:hypothetical protein
VDIAWPGGYYSDDANEIVNAFHIVDVLSQYRFHGAKYYRNSVGASDLAWRIHQHDIGDITQQVMDTLEGVTHDTFKALFFDHMEIDIKTCPGGQG